MNTSHTIGQRVTRVDGLAKATGQARFTTDMKRPDMLVAKVLFAQYPHAVIKSIDTAAAEQLPGVMAVMTAKDLPGKNAYGIMCADKPVIAQDKTHYEGDPVAIVAAKDEATALHAVSLIKVDYEVLPAYDDPREAMRENALPIHTCHPAAEQGNVLLSSKLDRGDVDKAFAEADIIIENDYETPMVDHCYMEPDCCIAEPDPLTGGLTLTTPAQAVYAAKRCLAPVFNIPHHKLRVISPIVGGGFGGKEDSTLDVCAVAGVLALKTQRTVYFELTREEVFRTTGKRHATYIRHRLAATRDGKVTAIDVQTILDKGAYVSMGGLKAPLHAVTMRTLIYAGGPYAIPNARARSCSVFTNHPYSCAFRGFGAPQAAFAVECQMDELARRLNMDPVALRHKNRLRHGDTTIFGQVMKESRGLGLGECLDQMSARLGWDKPLDRGQGTIRKGRGMAAFMYATGIPLLFEGASCYANMELDGTLTVSISSTEMGQGLSTVIAQVAGEVLGISVSKVLVAYGDTAMSPDGGPTVGSRSAVMLGNATRHACLQLRQRFLETAARYFFHNDPRDVDIADSKVFIAARPETTLDLSTVVAKAFTSQVAICAVGTWHPPLPGISAEDGQGVPSHAYTFGAHGVEISVDTETGVITVDRSVLACDMGKALNPMNVEGQMEGGVAQAIGWGVMEECLLEQGVMKNPAFHNYMIPTIKDLPDLESILVEHPNELGPFGAKGMGEPPIIGAGPALRNAVCDALGLHINSIPLTARRIVEALRDRTAQQKGESA